MYQARRACSLYLYIKFWQILQPSSGVTCLISWWCYELAQFWQDDHAYCYQFVPSGRGSRCETARLPLGPSSSSCGPASLFQSPPWSSIGVCWFPYGWFWPFPSAWCGFAPLQCSVLLWLILNFFLLCLVFCCSLTFLVDHLFYFQCRFYFREQCHPCCKLNRKNIQAWNISSSGRQKKVQQHNGGHSSIRFSEGGGGDTLYLRLVTAGASSLCRLPGVSSSHWSAVWL